MTDWNWIGYARTHKEFDVESELLDLGFAATVPRKVEAIRSGTRRWPEPRIMPYLPNYVFLCVDPANWPKLSRVKHLSRTRQAIPRTSAQPVSTFLARVEGEYLSRMSQIEAGERLAEYQPGDMLKILGPFGECLARFRSIVERADSIYPEIVAEIDIMGRAVTVRADPLHVKKAAC